MSASYRSQNRRLRPFRAIARPFVSELLSAKRARASIIDPVENPIARGAGQRRLRPARYAAAMLAGARLRGHHGVARRGVLEGVGHDADRCENDATMALTLAAPCDRRWSRSCSPARMDIIDQVNAALRAQGRTVGWLAKQTGRSPSPVYRVLSRREHEPSDATVQLWADTLGVELRRPAVAEVVFRPTPREVG